MIICVNKIISYWKSTSYFKSMKTDFEVFNFLYKTIIRVIYILRGRSLTFVVTTIYFVVFVVYTCIFLEKLLYIQILFVCLLFVLFCFVLDVGVRGSDIKYLLYITGMYNSWEFSMHPTIICLWLFGGGWGGGVAGMAIKYLLYVNVYSLRNFNTPNYYLFMFC